MKKTFAVLLAMVLTILLLATVSMAEDNDAIAQGQAANENLTIENCDELAELFALKNEFDESIAAFAEKYAGRVIEFDGNIGYISNHGTYKTRYDILVYAGDYSETSVSGPSFQFVDVGIRDLGISGLFLPDFVHAGANIHVTAKVQEFKEKQGLFILDPVLIEAR